MSKVTKCTCGLLKLSIVPTLFSIQYIWYY